MSQVFSIDKNFYLDTNNKFSNAQLAGNVAVCFGSYELVGDAGDATHALGDAFNQLVGIMDVKGINYNNLLIQSIQYTTYQRGPTSTFITCVLTAFFTHPYDNNTDTIKSAPNFNVYAQFP